MTFPAFTWKVFFDDSKRQVQIKFIPFSVEYGQDRGFKGPTRKDNFDLQKVKVSRSILTSFKNSKSG